MKDKKFSTKDYILVVLSLILFALSVLAVVINLSYAAIGCFCIFACVTITLVQSIASRPIPVATDSEEYIELKKKYEENKRVAKVKIGLLTAKLEEGNREKSFICDKYSSTVEELEELRKNSQNEAVESSDEDQDQKQDQGEDQREKQCQDQDQIQKLDQEEFQEEVQKESGKQPVPANKIKTQPETVEEITLVEIPPEEQSEEKA